MSDEDDDDFEFSDLGSFKINYDINRVPETFKPVMIEQVVTMSQWLMEAIEEDGKLMEMLTWSKERIASYEQALLQKHQAERGD
jgi:hypothetical protein